MIVAIKDHLKIHLQVRAEKVNITMPEMDDVIWLWNDWIREEEKLAQNFLEIHQGEDYYNQLAHYLKRTGWEIEEHSFSDS